MRIYTAALVAPDSAQGFVTGPKAPARQSYGAG